MYCLTVSTFQKFKLVRTGNSAMLKMHLATKYFDLVKVKHQTRSRSKEREQEGERTNQVFTKEEASFRCLPPLFPTYDRVDSEPACHNSIGLGWVVGISAWCQVS